MQLGVAELAKQTLGFAAYIAQKTLGFVGEIADRTLELADYIDQKTLGFVG